LLCFGFWGEEKKIVGFFGGGRKRCVGGGGGGLRAPWCILQMVDYI